MISSLKRYLQGTDNDPGMLRAVNLLLEGIALHAVEYDEADRVAFRAAIRKLEEELSARPEPNNALMAATAAVKEMEHYNRQIEKETKSLATELHGIVNILTKKVVEICDAGEKATTNLETIEHQIGKASQIEDIRVLRMRLGEALQGLQEEKSRQQQAASELTREFKANVERVRTNTQPPTLAPDVDAVTGLSGPESARACFAQACQQGGPYYLAALSINRLELIDNRYGNAIGDQMFLHASQHVAQRLSANDQLFRWNNTTLVAVMERAGTLPEVQAEIDRIGAARMERSVKLDQRSILLAVSADWMVIPFSQCPTAGMLKKRVDEFCGLARK